MIASGQRNNTKAFTSIIKDLTAKADTHITCNQVCVLAGKKKLSQFLYGKTLSMDIAPACCYENTYNFPQKSELSEVHTSHVLRWKLVSSLFFQRFPGWKWKMCGNQSRLFFLSHKISRLHLGSNECLCYNVSLLTTSDLDRVFKNWKT